MLEIFDLQKFEKYNFNANSLFSKVELYFRFLRIYFFQKNMSSSLNDNKVMETIDVPNNEVELRMAFARQTDELRLVRRQLANSQLRVKELEEQIRKLQRQ